MTIKFKKISKLLLRNDAHFQFHTEFKDQPGKTAAATEVTQIVPLWSKFQELYNIEDDGLKKIRKSALTDKIQEADRARDNAFTGIIV
jgi:hypothetical protein